MWGWGSRAFLVIIFVVGGVEVELWYWPYQRSSCGMIRGCSM
ncbi:hypothetical protein TNCT_113371, partial [Trichonephila clavata]